MGERNLRIFQRDFVAIIVFNTTEAHLSLMGATHPTLCFRLSHDQNFRRRYGHSVEPPTHPPTTYSVFECCTDFCREWRVAESIQPAGGYHDDSHDQIVVGGGTAPHAENRHSLQSFPSIHSFAYRYANKDSESQGRLRFFDLVNRPSTRRRHHRNNWRESPPSKSCCTGRQPPMAPNSQTEQTDILPPMGSDNHGGTETHDVSQVDPEWTERRLDLTSSRSASVESR